MDIAWKQIFIAFFLGVLVQGFIYNQSGLDDTIPPVNDTDNLSEVENRIDPESSFNDTKVELLVHEKVNEIRVDRGLSELKYSEHLHEIADRHSSDMVARDYFSHRSPDGKGFQQRYEDANYRCSVKSESSDIIYKGGENIAQSYWNGRVETKEGIIYTDSEEKLAEAIVIGWRHSSEHFQNMMKPYWNLQGIGVKSHDEKVLVTQNFC